MSFYTDRIREEVTALGLSPREYPAHWVEGWMRLERGTLDGLNRPAFRGEVNVACQCIDAASRQENESLAQSYGLKEER